MMLLLALPVTIEAEAVEVPAYNGQPLPALAEAPVAIVQPDGYVVIVSQFDAERLARPREETEAEQDRHLCFDLQAAKPWIDWGCE